MQGGATTLASNGALHCSAPKNLGCLCQPTALLTGCSVTPTNAACDHTGGSFEFKMEFPVSGVHTMQVTGREEFIIIVSW